MCVFVVMHRNSNGYKSDVFFVVLKAEDKVIELIAQHVKVVSFDGKWIG